MEIREILLVLVAGEPCEGAVEVAGLVARRHEAMVEAVCLYAEPAVSRRDGETSIQRRRRREQLAQALIDPVEALFRKTIVAAGRAQGWSSCLLEGSAEPLMRRARLADVVVMSTAPLGEARNTAETLAFGSGTPCLLVPCGERAHDLDRVAIAWDGSREAKRSLDAALDPLKRAAKVAVVIVEEDVANGPNPDDAKALVRHLAKHDVEAEVRTVKADGRPVGKAILDECRSFGADLVVMGAFGASPFHERMLGGATRTALREATFPILMSH
jgi:nucleotide-binding universal stress UspA family protein